MRLLSFLFLHLLLLIFPVGLRAQSETGVISGTISDEKGEVIPGISVLLEETMQGVATDANGHFEFKKVTPGTYKLQTSGVGYSRQLKKITLDPGQKLQLTIQMKEDTRQLDEVTVRGKSIAREKMEQPIKVDAIDATKLQAQSTTLPQIINQTAGVNVRQTAGVGSGTTININGMQGRAIRFFRDEIPLDYLGQAYELSLVPIGQLSGIEIYKGVLPAKLGADALGGAVNFTTREFYDNQLDLSYGYGSFNTHHANLAGYWNVPGTKFFAQLSSYYVYSDNDYKINVEVVDEVTQTLKPAVVERFHDAVESSFAEAKAGIKDTRFADLFEVGYTRFDLDKENQHGFNILRPFGEASYEESFNAFTSRYKKKIGRIEIDLFGAYSKKSTFLTDTSSRRYDWFGNVTATGGTNGGESNDDNKSLLNLDFDHTIGRIFLSYQLGASTLSFNHNLVSQNRIGSDPLGYKVSIDGENIDPFTVPADYLKHVSGLQLTTNFLQDKLTHLVTAKRYNVTTSSLSRTSYEDFTPHLSSESYGVGSSLKYSISDHRFLRVSYERATRIPEPEEYFGDGRFIIGNNDLQPEQSDNLNLGFYTNLDRSKDIFLDVNAFYRYVDGQIILQPIWLILSQYQNKDVAEVKGIEASLKATLSQRLKANLGVTYQDARRINIEARDQQVMEGARLPFRPYFFSNLNLNYDLPDLFSAGDKVSIYLNHSFIEKYVYIMIPESQEPGLFEPVDNSSLTNLEDLIIPTQNIVDLGISYQWPDKPLWINAEVINLLDTKAFDNFRIQKAPRNFRIKLRYVLSKN